MDFATVKYLAPEVESDYQLDIYALGMACYELLLGDKRYRRNLPKSTIQAQE